VEKEREKLPCAGMIPLVLIPVTPSGAFPFPFALPTPWRSLLPREDQGGVREPASSPLRGCPPFVLSQSCPSSPFLRPRVLSVVSLVSLSSLLPCRRGSV